MIPRGLLLIGCGGHARSVADVALDLGVEELLFVDVNARPGETIGGFAVTPIWPHALRSDWCVMPAAGSASARARAVGEARRQDLALAALVSRRAYVASTAVVMPGAFVAHGAHVGPYARIGEGAIVNTGAVVDHESVVEAYAHVAVNATVAGRCTVGANSALGAGAVVIDNVSVGADISIGAGGVVVADLVEPGVYVGVPVRRVQSG